MSHTTGAPDPPPTYRANRGYYCLDCGYNLRGLEHHTCPECGRPFNPDDSHTYNAFPPSKLETFGNKLMFGRTALSLIEHLPAKQQKEIMRSVKRSPRMRRYTYIAFPIFVAVGVCTMIVFNYAKSHEGFAQFAPSILMLLLMSALSFTGYVLRRAYGDELRRMNIRPAICPKCGYNLAGIDAPRCPKCDTPLTNET